jgi:hypothetical protein
MKRFNLLPIVIIHITFISLSANNAFSQECDCNNYLNTIYDYTKIQRSENFKAAFKEWFFSDKFEQDEKNESTSIDITVPIYDVPVDFGYGHESADAWKKWEKYRKSTAWDFSKITMESMFLKVPSAQARQIWLECVQSQCNTKFPVQYKTLASGGIALTVGYNSNLLDIAPTYTDFAC